MRYARNRIYLSETDQQTIKHYKLFLAGCGIGSVIAECALRLGFEHITIVDGDRVEESNLNRQNYLQADVDAFKGDSIARRLTAINPNARIVTHNVYLTQHNLEPLLAGHDAAINALDFQSDVPFQFDHLCARKGMPVLHPYNIGWAGLLFVLVPGGEGLERISPNYEGFERSVVSFFLDRLDEEQKSWVGEVLAQYAAETERLSPPQLSVGSWLLGGLCADVLFRLATGRDVKAFPDFHFVSAR